MPRPSEIKLNNAAAAWRAGEKRATIARRLGVSVSTLRKWAKANNWDISPESAGAAPGSTTFTRAAKLYETLAVQLEASIETLREQTAEGTTDGKRSDFAKSILEQIKSHQKALQTVLDCQTRLLKIDRTRPAAAQTSALDLQAARDELHRRLDRLAAAAKS